MTTNRETINQIKGTIFVQEMLSKTGRGGFFWKQVDVDHYQAINYVEDSCSNPPSIPRYWEYNVTKNTLTPDPIYILDVVRNGSLYYKTTSNFIPIVQDLYLSVEARSQNDDRLDQVIDAALAIHDHFDSFYEYNETGSGGTVIGGGAITGGRNAYWYGPTLEGSSRGEIIGNGGADIAGESPVSMPIQTGTSGDGGASLSGEAFVRMAERYFDVGNGGVEAAGEAFVKVPGSTFDVGNGGISVSGSAVDLVTTDPSIPITQTLLPSLTLNPGVNPGTPWNWLGSILSIRDSVDRPDEDASYIETYVASSSNYDNPMPMRFDPPSIACDFYTRIDVRIVWKIDRSVVLSPRYFVNPTLHIKGQKFTTGVLNDTYVPYPAEIPKGTTDDPSCICGCDHYQTDVFSFYPPNLGSDNYIDTNAGSTGTYIRSYPTDYFQTDFPDANSALWTNSDVSNLTVNLNSLGRGVRITAIDVQVTGYPSPISDSIRYGRGGVMARGTCLTDGDPVVETLGYGGGLFQGPYYIGNLDDLAQDVNNVDSSKYVQFVVNDPPNWNSEVSYAEFFLTGMPTNTNSFNQIEMTAVWESPSPTTLVVTIKADNSSTVIWSNTFTGVGGTTTSTISGEWLPEDLENLTMSFRLGIPGGKVYALRARVTGPFGSTNVNFICKLNGGGAKLGGCSLVSGGSDLQIGGAMAGGEAYVTMIGSAPVNNIVGSGGILCGGICLVEPLTSGRGGASLGGDSVLWGGSGVDFGPAGKVTQFLKPSALIQQGSWTGDWNGLKTDYNVDLNDATAMTSDTITIVGTRVPMVLQFQPTFYPSGGYTHVYVTIRVQGWSLPGYNNVYLTIYVGSQARIANVSASSDGSFVITSSTSVASSSNTGVFTQAEVDNIKLYLMGSNAMRLSAVTVAVVSGG